MLFENDYHKMNVSSLMVHVEQIEKKNIKKTNREIKRSRTGDANFSNARLDGQGRQRFKHRLPKIGYSSAYPMVNKDRVLKPKPQGGL